MFSRSLLSHDSNITAAGTQFGGFTVSRDNTAMNCSTACNAAGATSSNV